MLINIPLNIYDSLKDDNEFKKKFKKEVIDKVLKNFNDLKKKNSGSDVFKYLTSTDIENILLGNVVNNKNTSFVDQYRKTITFSEVDFAKRVENYKEEYNYNIKINDLFKEYYEHYKNIFLSDLLDMKDKEIIHKLETTKGFNDLRTKTKKKLDIFNEDIKKIFSFYKEYICKTELRAEILQATRIVVCPYCNRQYTTPFYVKNKKRIQADLEHFYPKSKYPLFSLSIMNFIPCCLFCNRNLKGNKIFDNLYFINNLSNNKSVFKDRCENYNQLVGIDNSKLTIDIESLAEEDIFNKIDMHYYKTSYHLDEIYNTHSEFIREQKIRRTIYNKDYMKKINKELKKELKLSGMELNNFIFGYSGSNEELTKKTLSKLVHDVILNE